MASPASSPHIRSPRSEIWRYSGLVRSPSQSSPRRYYNLRWCRRWWSYLLQGLETDKLLSYPSDSSSSTSVFSLVSLFFSSSSLFLFFLFGSPFFFFFSFSSFSFDPFPPLLQAIHLKKETFHFHVLNIKTWECGCVGDLCPPQFFFIFFIFLIFFDLIFFIFLTFFHFFFVCFFYFFKFLL